MADREGAVNAWFNKLDPKLRRWLVIGSAGALVVIAVALFVVEEPRLRPARDRQEVVKDILRTPGSKSLSASGLAARQNVTDKKVHGLEKEIAKLREEQERRFRDYARKQERAEQQAENLLKKARQELAVQRPSRGSVTAGEQQSGDATRPDRRPSAAERLSLPPRSKAPVTAPSAPTPAATPPNWAAFAVETPISKPPAVRSRAADRIGAEKVGDSRSGSRPTIAMIDRHGKTSSAAREAGAKKSAAGKNDDDGGPARKGPYLPAGSMMRAVVLSGLDAPANSAAQDQPHPALLRVKGEVILPNERSMDLSGCFIIAAGFGKLSDHRVYLRSETLSCITEDNAIIETPIQMFASGPDGKAGVRGTVVNKRGQVLAKTLMAGFISNLADMFQPARVESLATSPTGTALFQTPDVGEALRTGALGGTKNALEKLADSYLELLDEIFPVIELHAGTRVDFTVVKGGFLNAKGTTL